MLLCYKSSICTVRVSITDPGMTLVHSSTDHLRSGRYSRTPIQPSLEGEFRQHDGVVTMMMFYRPRASPKHRYSISEVEYGGGGHRTWLKDQTINCCVSGVPPAPVYKGARGGCGRPGSRRARRSPTPTGSRTPPFPSWIRTWEGERVEEKKEGGRRPLSLSYSD